MYFFHQRFIGSQRPHQLQWHDVIKFYIRYLHCNCDNKYFKMKPEHKSFSELHCDKTKSVFWSTDDWAIYGIEGFHQLHLGCNAKALTVSTTIPMMSSYLYLYCSLFTPCLHQMQPARRNTTKDIKNAWEPIIIKNVSTLDATRQTHWDQAGCHVTPRLTHPV